MTYQEASEWMAASRTRGILPGLSRISRLLAILGDPQNGLLIVHVAGTNGKGSVCACLASVLQAGGHRTGFFSSPPLLEPEEMFRIDGQTITKAQYAKAVEAMRNAARDMVEEPGLPTEYELYAAMAFWLFQREKCAVVVLETCMGGRFDTTNAYAGQNLAVLTSISLDHTRFLGESLREIAWHKAGIFRAGCPAVSAPQHPEVAREILDCARQTGTSLTLSERSDLSQLSLARTGSRFELQLPGTAGVDATWSGTYTVSLVGVHQAENAALAITALHQLNRWKPALRLNPEVVRQGLLRVSWPCRFEVFAGPPALVIDGAHNPDGMRRFVETFRIVFPGKKATVLFGALRDKDVAGMLDCLCGVTGRILLLEPDSPRAMPVDELEALARERFNQIGAQGERMPKISKVTMAGGCCDLQKHDTIQSAMDIGFQNTDLDGVLVAIGSLTWVGAFRHTYLSGRPDLARAHACCAEREQQEESDGG